MRGGGEGTPYIRQRCKCRLGARCEICYEEVASDRADFSLGVVDWMDMEKANAFRFGLDM